MFTDPTAPRTEHAERMRFINEQPSTMRVLQIQQPRQVRDVAIHAVETFDNNETIARFPTLHFQYQFQVLEIIMSEHHNMRSRGSRASENAVVTKFIDKQKISRSEQVRDDRYVCQIAADKRQRRIRSHKARDRVLKLCVDGALAANQPRTEDASPKTSNRLGRCVIHSRVSGKTKIVVVGKAREHLATRFNFGAQLIEGDEPGITAIEDGPTCQASSPLGKFDERRIRFHATCNCPQSSHLITLDEVLLAKPLATYLKHFRA